MTEVVVSGNFWGWSLFMKPVEDEDTLETRD